MKALRELSVGPAGEHVSCWGAPDAPAFVLLHSLGLDGGSFRWLAQAMLSQAKVQLVAPDLRGHGKSPATAGAITLLDMAADVVQTVQVLGIARAHLVGTSMGSAVARLAVGLNPSLWLSATLIAGGAGPVPALAQRGDAALQDGMGAVVDETLHRWFTPHDMAQPGPQVQYARKCLLRMNPSAWAGAWRALASYPAPGPLPAGVPGLCIAGELDTSATSEVVAAMRQATAVCRPVVLVPGAGHQLALSHAAELAKLLLSHWHAQEEAV